MAVAALVLTAVRRRGYLRQPTEGQPGSLGSRRRTPQPAPRPAVVLDGTYRFVYDYEKQTINGAPYAVHTSRQHRVVGVSHLVWTDGMRRHRDPARHQQPRGGARPAQSGDYRFVDGHWQSTPVHRPLNQSRCLGADGQVVAGANTAVLTWSLDPQPDGTLRGVMSAAAITNECGFAGQVALAPFVATRVGDVPNGVTVADPAPAAAAPSTSTTAQQVPGPALDGTYRLDFDLQNQTIDGTVTGLGAAVTEWWAFRSVCTSAGCAAAGSQLAESNQQEGTGTSSVLQFADGHWQGTPTLQAPMGCDKTNKPGHEDETRLWSLGPAAQRHVQGRADRHRAQQRVRHPRDAVPDPVRRDPYR